MAGIRDHASWANGSLCPAGRTAKNRHRRVGLEFQVVAGDGVGFTEWIHRVAWHPPEEGPAGAPEPRFVTVVSSDPWVGLILFQVVAGDGIGFIE